MICRNKLNEMVTAPAHTSAVNAIDTSGCVGPADGQAVNKWHRLKGSSTGLISSGELQILSAGIIWGSIGIYGAGGRADKKIPGRGQTGKR